MSRGHQLIVVQRRFGDVMICLLATRGLPRHRPAEDRACCGAYRSADHDPFQTAGTVVIFRRLRQLETDRAADDPSDGHARRDGDDPVGGGEALGRRALRARRRLTLPGLFLQEPRRLEA